MGLQLPLDSLSHIVLPGLSAKSIHTMSDQISFGLHLSQLPAGWGKEFDSLASLSDFRY